MELKYSYEYKVLNYHGAEIANERLNTVRRVYLIENELFSIELYL